MATEGKTRAPAVDGKRLAHLEAGASALAMTLAANGLQLEGGADPIEQAIAIVKRWRELTLERAEVITSLSVAIGVDPITVAELPPAIDGALSSMKERIVSLETDLAKLAEQSAEEANDGALEQLRKRVRALELENKELQQDVEDLANAKNDLANKLAAADKPSAPELPPEPEKEPELVIARERPETARDVGPSYGLLSPRELQAAIDAGVEFELAFSNGDYELIEFSSPDLKVPAKLLQRVDATRVRLKDGVEVKGAGAVEKIHGAGLLLEGVQVAYHTFDPTVVVRPNEHWRLQPVFG